MKNKMLIVFLILAVSGAHFTFGQISVSGNVKDKKDKTALPGASVVLENINNRSEKFIAVADTSGFFQFKNIAGGTYLLKATYIGYASHKEQVALKEKSTDLGTVLLEPTERKLKEVTVEGARQRVVLRGDTTVFKAGAYKTMPDANAEDLVKKMPGVVISGGKVQAEGEDVRQVLVDGRPFFGEDPNIALKNLPAEMVEEVQIFDEQSEQAQFTGFDDGNTKKTMNLVTKKNMRNGRFGKIYGGFGYEDNDEYDTKYSLGGNLNVFNNEQRISIIAQSNNINIQNFSIEDILGAIGNGNMMIRRLPGGGGRGSGPRIRIGGDGFNAPGVSIDDFMVEDQGGVSSVNALGINYSDQWGKKINITGSYFFNQNKNVSEESVYQQYQLSDEPGLVYFEDQKSASDNYNHRLNLKFEYNIDDNNSLLIRPRVTFQDNSSNSVLSGGSFQNGKLLNSADGNYRSSLTGYNFSNGLLFRHKFGKPGRTFSVSFDVEKNETSGDNQLFSVNRSFENEENNEDTVDQVSDLNINGYSLSSRFVYTEPISANGLVQVNYQATYRNEESGKETFNYNPLSGEYSRQDSTLTNIFESKNIIHRVGTGYRWRSEKSRLTVGADYQVSELESNNLFPEYARREYTFGNILPNARFHSRFSDKNHLEIMYRTSTSNPSVTQLQNVIDNSNPLQLSVGNPELEQQYHHNVMMRFGSIGKANSKIFFGALGGGITNNYITNSTQIIHKDSLIADDIILPAGGQMMKPVNLDGSWNLHSFVTYGTPVKLLSSNLNLIFSANYSHIPALINRVKSYTNNTTFRAGIVLGSNIDENMDFTLSSHNSFSTASNSQQSALNDEYFTFFNRLDFSWQFWKRLIFRSDVTYESYLGLSDSYNQNYTLWNLSLGTKFMEGNKGEISVKVYDLLSQNNSIRRNVTATYIEDVKTNVLQRYFMVSFTYNFRDLKESK